MDCELSESQIDKLLELSIELEQIGQIELSILVLKLLSPKGDVTSITKLADMLSDYDGFSDLPAAEQLYKEACLAGYFPACYNLGVLYAQLGRDSESQKFITRSENLQSKLP